MDQNSTGLVNYSTDFLPIEPKLWALALLVFLPLCIATISGNILVLVAFKKERKLRTVTNYFLVSLAVSDLLIGLISMPLYSIYVLKDESWIFGKNFCKFYLSVDYTVSGASALHLLLISLDRYLSISRPLWYRPERTARRVLIAITIVWTVAFLTWTPWIVLWPYFTDGEEHLRPDPDGRTQKCFITFLEDFIAAFATSVWAFFLPVMVIVVLYIRIWWITYTRSKRFQKDMNRSLFLKSKQPGLKPSSDHQSRGQNSVTLTIPEEPQVRRTRGESNACLGPNLNNVFSSSFSNIAEDCEININAEPASKTAASNRSNGAGFVGYSSMRPHGKTSKQGNESRISSYPDFSDSPVSVSKQVPKLKKQVNSTGLESGKVGRKNNLLAFWKSSANTSSESEELHFSQKTKTSSTLKIPRVARGHKSNSSELQSKLGFKSSDLTICGNNNNNSQDLGKDLIETPEFQRRDANSENNPRNCMNHADKTRNQRTNGLKSRRSGASGDRKAARVLSLIAAAFILTWTPYNVLVILQAFGFHVTPFIWTFFYWLCYINSTLNPICYGVANETFRQTFVSIFTGNQKRQHGFLQDTAAPKLQANKHYTAKAPKLGNSHSRKGADIVESMPKSC